MRVPTRPVITVLLIAAAAAAAVCICPMVGISFISPNTILRDSGMRFIFLSIRIPRTLGAFCAGGGLAVAGLIYQAIFRNPLADPYTLGVSGGASLGAAVCIAAGLGGSALGMSFVTAGALSGAVLSIMVLYMFAWSRESNSTTLLLAGVIVATVSSGCVMFLHFLSGPHRSFQILRWIMGAVDGVNYPLLLLMALPLAAFLAVTAVFIPHLDHFLTGDDIAQSRGVNIRASRNMFIIVTALAIGCVVSVCGPIGFTGIIAPHACRMMLPGARHRLLAACSFLLGATLLVLADTLSRSVAPPAEIPVGIITAIVGGPFFLIILVRKRARLLM